MIFHKGKLTKDDKNAEFKIGNEGIHIVNQFKYLGFIFTQQLRFSDHVKKVHAKAS